MCSAKKVDMISIHAHRLHLDLISLLYARSRLSDYLDNLFVEKGFPVLDREDDMIMNLPRTVVSFSDSAFSVHLFSITRPPVAIATGSLITGKNMLLLPYVLRRTPENHYPTAKQGNEG